MSTRYGIELVLDPVFTARAYRTRNTVCGQFGSWAAEMQILRMSLVSYFQCPDTAVSMLTQASAHLAEESQRCNPGFAVDCRGVASGPIGDPINVFLEFQTTDADHPLTVLQRDAMTLVGQLPGAVPPPDNGEFRPKIILMESANLPPAVMSEAFAFAKGVAEDMEIPSVANARSLVLLRYHSEAAGDDWSHGGWAPDLRWEYLSSYAL